ncbi:carbon-nitrogen family hydrolase [Peptoniphilus sp.]|jgi:omega-amidase|uniref:carbon-nitrogen family hydrolase n=1 Tax=Peptoniphilus sp. TaxID=1971214 RepID=UPI003D8CC0D5
MKITVIQCELVLGDVKKNFEIAEDAIKSAAEEKSDVVVLPELWDVSFFPKNVRDLADVEGRRTKKFLEELSKKYNINIVGGSVANIIDGKLYNTCYIYDRNGKEVGMYNKVHLFSPSGEHEIFSAGDKLVTFELDGVKCGVSICYDVRFVEWVRMNALKDIEIFFLPAAWPDVRTMHWDTLNRARAIENQMFVVCVNSLGKAYDTKFGGHSAIIDPWGEYVIKPNEEVGNFTGEVDLSVIKGIRESINVFRDRRPELYKF